jgi:hypothetical protein
MGVLLATLYYVVPGAFLCIDRHDFMFILFVRIKWGYKFKSRNYLHLLLEQAHNGSGTTKKLLQKLHTAP